MAERNFNTAQWNDEDAYWRQNYRSRPYASADTDYDVYRPGYRYGFDAANRFQGREWKDIEADLSRSWESYKERGKATWHEMKDAVQDAWERVTGRHPAPYAHH